MRVLTLLLLLAGACDKSNQAYVVDLPDAATMPSAPSDMAMHSEPDLSEPRLSCAQMANCVTSCGSDSSCITECYFRGTPHAQTLANELAACIGHNCTATGLARCVSYPGDTSPGCLACIYNSEAGWVGGAACTPPTDSACDLCGKETQTCLEDL
jgi:hypothetical protein